MREMTGGCLCGQVRYSASVDPTIVVVCHCKDCQKQSGTAFSVEVGVPKSTNRLGTMVQAFKKSASDTRHLLCVTERRAEGAVQSNIMGQQNAGYAKGGG
jgi:hypothetical protein